MLLRQVWVVFRKELVDSVRDRRSLLSALLYPALALVIGLLLTVFVERESTDAPLRLPVAGAENGPLLVSFLEHRGVEVVDAPGDAEDAVRNRREVLILEIGEDFAEDFHAGRPAPVRIVVDESQGEARRPLHQTTQLLAAFAEHVAFTRLLARGVSPDVAAVVQIEEVDVATPQQHAANVLNTLPLLLILAAFFGGMQVAIDTTAGERERGSLEALLISPTPRSAIVLGKWGVTVVFSIVSVIVTEASCIIVMADVPLEQMGLALRISPALVGRMLIAVLPLPFLAAAIQMLVATFARSFKEAQTYLSALLFVPMLPGFLLAIHPIETESWMVLLPTLSQTLFVGDVMKGVAISTSNLVLATLSTFSAAALCLALTTKLIERERIIFGR